VTSVNWDEPLPKHNGQSPWWGEEARQSDCICWGPPEVYELPTENGEQYDWGPKAGEWVLMANGPDS
jgi:hypothetical protein